MTLNIGLSLIVKDEEEQLVDCLDPIAALLDEIVIVDTGSTDGTCTLLRERYGIEPLHAALDPGYCNSKSPARNLGYSRCHSDWIIRLDADERLTGTDIAYLRQLEPDAGTGGYFVAWNTYRGEEVTRDYKLLMFRNGIEARGAAHENMQIDIRDKGFTAPWLDAIELRHYPDVSKDPWKATFYRDRLNCAIGRDPGFIRYYWFLGYACYRRSETDDAIDFLEVAAQSKSRRFPVECLNAHMVLTAIHAERGEREELGHRLDAMEAFFDAVCADFEVRINRHLAPWIEGARAAYDDAALGRIKPRSFAT